MPEQFAKTYGKQTSEVVSGTTIKFKNATSIYKINASTDVTYTLDTSALDVTQNSYVFEIWVYMETPKSISFNNVTWIQEPSMLDAGLYCFVFRTIPTKFNDNVTFTAPSIIANLAYRHDVTKA